MSDPGSAKAAPVPEGRLERPPGLKGRQWRRRLWFGLSTLLGLGRRGFFIPYRYADAMPAFGTNGAYPAVEALMAARQDQFLGVLRSLDRYQAALRSIGDHPPPAPRWAQGWFPRLDGAVLYALLREKTPARVVEVGSGHSTRFAHQAISDGGLDCRVTAIDPAPRADIAALPIDLRRDTLQSVGIAPFEGLGPGDFVLVDSSHILMPGSDVDFLLGRVFPLLPAGVYLQVHDIFLPDDYPKDWAWRAYNEQQGVLPMVLGGDWEVVFASHYVASRMGEALLAGVAGELLLPQGAMETALWLRKR